MFPIEISVPVNMIVFMSDTKDLVELAVITESYKRFTTRRLEYLALAGIGFSNEEIAQLLCVTVYTVKKTFEIIFDLLHAIDKENAIYIACIHNLLPLKLCNEILERYPDAKKMLLEKRRIRESIIESRKMKREVKQEALKNAKRNSSHPLT